MGLDTARAFARGGASVALADVSEAALQRAVGQARVVDGGFTVY
jgi:NAD(P)-dependent dehydrogenase (short-subunit alcohol dehydrogenase family)